MIESHGQSPAELKRGAVTAMIHETHVRLKDTRGRQCQELRVALQMQCEQQQYCCRASDPTPQYCPQPFLFFFFFFRVGFSFFPNKKGAKKKPLHRILTSLFAPLCFSFTMLRCEEKNG